MFYLFQSESLVSSTLTETETDFNFSRMHLPRGLGKRWRAIPASSLDAIPDFHVNTCCFPRISTLINHLESFFGPDLSVDFLT